MRKTIKIIIFTLISFFSISGLFIIGNQYKDNTGVEAVNVQKQPTEKYNYDPNLPLDGVVDFPDENFKIKLNREYFSQSDDHDITRSQMEMLSSLYLSGSIDDSHEEYAPGDMNFINDINGIQYAKNISTLRISNIGNGLSKGEFVDLTPLSNLTQINDLSLSKNMINDFGPLKNLVNLQSFYFYGGWIENAPPLISNVDVISNFVNLTYLDLTFNGGYGYENKDNIFEYIQNLSELKYIELTGFTGVRPPSKTMAFNDEVVELQIRNSNKKERGVLTEFDDISFVQNMKNLSDLEISGTNLSEIPDLSMLTNLGRLDLSINEIYDFTPLNNLNIDFLSLRGQIINIPYDNSEHENPLPEFYITLINGDRLKVDFGDKSFLGKHEYIGFFDEDSSDLFSIGGKVTYEYNWNGTWVDINEPAIEHPFHINWNNIALILLATIITTAFLLICIV